MIKKISALLIPVIMCLILSYPFSVKANAAKVLPFTGSLDYSLDTNWLYDGAYPENGVDVFMVAPTVDTKSESNASITPEYKKRFRYAMNQQQAIYAKTARIYAPYYRQASMNVYSLTDAEREQVLANAYLDVSAAFKYYLEHKNNGRPLILAGFSQGADMCYRLLEEYYGGNGETVVALRKNLIATYAIGWAITEEMVSKYPQIVPAQGETDTGVVVSFDCENGNVTDSIVIPSGTKAISINPLNWRTDSKKASKDLNMGTVTQDSKTGAITSVVIGKYGAYIDPDRGSLIVTGIDTSTYPPVLPIFSEGCFHLYDNFLFFVNLQENVQKRTDSFWNSIADKAA